MANGNKLVVRVDPDLGAMTSDEVRLRQAALNLLSNAAKFTTRGVVTLSARRFQADAGDWIEIEVRDTGIGIAPEDMKTLFQDFRQVNSRQSRKAKGTGLGLALSQKLCAHDGRRHFRSTANSATAPASPFASPQSCGSEGIPLKATEVRRQRSTPRPSEPTESRFS